MKTIYVGMSADIVHHGHINLINKASQYGDVIIGLLSDDAINSYKRTPIINYDNREKVVKEMKHVKKVIKQDTLDYTKNLMLIKPDYVMHADDWKEGPQRQTREKVIETLKKWNGQLVEIPYTNGVSTTAIINKIINTDVVRKSYINKSKLLRELLFSDKLEFIMEAHNGMSAKIVEKTGFKAIWGSGLCLSASLGVRDSNEASWSQVLDQLEYMANAVDIPILVDGDTGFGNFNNARIFCRKLEERGIGGVCFEDKLFPKQNSFVEVEGGQKLANIDEFAGKIRACVEHRVNPYFVIVARLESFIAGKGLDDAYKRAVAYHKAGADVILVHSKISDCSDIEKFMKKWDNRCPIVIVPTTYGTTPTNHFRNIGVNNIIWANHNLRTSITAMEKLCKEIYETETISNVQNNIATVKDIFNYTKTPQLKIDEKKYS
jgi:phosphoenolpyruvate mutase